MKSAKPLKMVPAQRQTLEAWVRKPTLPQGVAVRARICLLAAAGMANGAIARKLDVSCMTVLLWRRRFQQRGTAGLAENAPHGPCARRIDDATVRRIVDATLHTTPPPGATRWTTRTLAARIGIGSATVARIWKAHGLLPHRAEIHGPARNKPCAVTRAVPGPGGDGCSGKNLPQTHADPTAVTDTDNRQGARQTRATQRDIARLAGVSTATVSLALRDHPRLSATTRAQVHQAARKLGYHADPVLAALAAHRWHRRPVTAGSTLAALVDDSVEGMEGVAERAPIYGYRIDVFQLRDYPDPRRLAEVLYARGIQGLIVGQIFTPGFCAAFDWSRFAAVACCEGDERPPVHLVMPNHFRAVQQAWDWAWGRGFRRIGLAIFDEPRAIDPHDRRAAFLDRQQRAPAAQRVSVLAVKPWVKDDAVLKPGMIRHDEAVQQTRVWMQQERPDIVLGFNAIFRWLLHDAGWRAPHWQAFVDLWTSDPAATGTRFDGYELGRRAVDWVDSLLRAGERGLPRYPSTMLVDFEWQDGACPPSPSSPLKKQSDSPRTRRRRRAALQNTGGLANR